MSFRDCVETVTPNHYVLPRVGGMLTEGIAKIHRRLFPVANLKGME